MPIILVLPIATLLTIALILLCSPLARRIGLVDVAVGHRQHAGNIPLVGGIAMFCGFMFGVLLLDQPLSAYRPLFAGAGLLIIIGVLDDFQELPPSARFVAQIAAAALMVLLGDVRLLDLGALTGPATVAVGSGSLVLTIFAVVGVINAFNMIDGSDGLAGGVALVALGLLAVAAATTGASDLPMLLILAAVVVGFLLFNLRYPGRPRLLVFMGDAGSMFLGFGLAWFLVALSQGPARSIAPVSALWLVALPLCDAVCSLLRRLVQRRSPFLADRHHLHHLLPALGLGEGQSLALLLGASLLLGIIGIAAPVLGAPEHWLFWGFVWLFLLYCGALALGWRRVAARARD